MSAPPLASVIPWEQVCRMLEKVQGEARPRKKEMLLKFISHFRELHCKKRHHQPDCQDSFFPVLRVLLPGLDRERGAYGVKERRLADLYIRILGLKKDGNDAQKLINFRKPKSSAGGDSGDFAEVAYYVLRSRCVAGGKLSLHDVDQHLTSIAENHAARNQEAVERSLLQMLNAMSAKEQKWLIRVLLKDMRLGLGQTAIFTAWHPDAKDYYDVTNSLQKVCTTLQDPSTRLHEVEVSLFSPFRPMLAQRAVLERVEAQMGHKTYFCETKFDGERSQIHKKGRDYRYYSRNGFDFTINFGGDDVSGLFTPHLHPNLSRAREVILDGEMVGWSKAHHTIVSKGELLDVRHLKEEGDWQVCFCAFDILLLNGKVLTNKPLSERLDILRSVITPSEGRVIISATSKVKSKEDVVAALNEAIDRREEGVVLKDPDSVYQPAARRAGWIKVKPEYVDSLVPELDLVILGGFYGKGSHQGCLSHFLLGVAVPSEEPGGRPHTFHSFTRVGSGYTVEELQELVDKLKPHTRPRQPSSVCVGREKLPDVWVEPCHSFVVQVRAAEVVRSDLYRAGVTLRFPRVERVRYDKPWHQALTTTELRELVQEARGKLALKHCGDDLGGEGARGAKRKATARAEAPSLPAHFRPADVSSAVKKDEIFGGLEMCVMGGDTEMSKHCLERMVVEHGGTLTQHPSPATHCIVANTATVRVRGHIASARHNVVRPCWVAASCSSGRLLPWGPLDVLHLREKERCLMEEMFDAHGDSYTEPTDGRTVRRLMEKMDEQSWRPLSMDEMSAMDERLCDLGDPRALFRRVTAYFDEDVDDQLAALTLRLHGGTVTHSPASATHLIVGCGSQVRGAGLQGRHLVTCEWVFACVQRGKHLQESHYMPRPLTH